MEVHHHSHLASGETHSASKKWTHYFWEFLMLFLAVTLGFFVENKREHFIEGKRASHLVRSLIKDLKKDTALLNWLDSFRIEKRKVRLDSFYSVLNNQPATIDKKVFYPLFYRVLEWYPFAQSTGTLNQLKNAGYLRYFSDNKLLDYISDYEFLIQDFKNDEDMEFHLHYDKLAQLVKQNSDNDELYSFFIKGIIPSGNGIHSFDAATLKSIKGFLIEQMWYNKAMVGHNQQVRKKATEFIIYLQSLK